MIRNPENFEGFVAYFKKPSAPKGPSKSQIASQQKQITQQRAQDQRNFQQQMASQRAHTQALLSSQKFELPSPPSFGPMQMPAFEEPPPPPTEDKREIRDAQDDEKRQARRRKGIRSTRKAGETGASKLGNPAGGQKKSILG